MSEKRRNDTGNCVVVFAVLVSVAALITFAAKALPAPVPSHLMPQADAITPGYRWHFGPDVLRVDWAEGELVGFVNETNPQTCWTGCHGVNVQTKSQTLAEAARYGQPAGWRERLHYPEPK